MHLNFDKYNREKLQIIYKNYQAMCKTGVWATIIRYQQSDSNFKLYTTQLAL